MMNYSSALASALITRLSCDYRQIPWNFANAAGLWLRDVNAWQLIDGLIDQCANQEE